MAPPRRRAAQPRGRFLVLEGLDGAGTTTQTGELVRRLVARGVPAVATAEPSRGPVGSLIRLALGGRLRGFAGRDFDRAALALLFAADRLDHVAAEVLPRLAEGTWVVSDRYGLSSLAYQALDVPGDFVEAINARAPAPDLTLFLEVPPDIALGRRASRAEVDIFDRLELQKRIAENYRRAIASGAAGSAVQVVDGTLGVAAVAEAVEGHVAARFGIGRSRSRRR